MWAFETKTRLADATASATMASALSSFSARASVKLDTRSIGCCNEQYLL